MQQPFFWMQKPMRICSRVLHYSRKCSACEQLLLNYAVGICWQSQEWHQPWCLQTSSMASGQVPWWQWRWRHHWIPQRSQACVQQRQGGYWCYGPHREARWLLGEHTAYFLLGFAIAMFAWELVEWFCPTDLHTSCTTVVLSQDIDGTAVMYMYCLHWLDFHAGAWPTRKEQTAFQEDTS